MTRDYREIVVNALLLVSLLVIGVSIIRGCDWEAIDAAAMPEIQR